jgi:hypothetical protein
VPKLRACVAIHLLPQTSSSACGPIVTFWLAPDHIPVADITPGLQIFISRTQICGSRYSGWLRAGRPRGQAPRDSRLYFNALQLWEPSNSTLNVEELNFFEIIYTNSSLTFRDRVVGIATGYGLDDQRVGFRVPVGARIFTSPCRPD